MRVIWILILILSSGCGYQFQGAGSILPPDVKTVAISPTENRTTEPGLSQKFREALRERFDRYGAVKVVSDASSADAVLKTVIKEVSSQVRNTSGTTDQGVDQVMVVTISGELKKKSGQILWKTDNLQVYQSYAEVSGVVVTTAAGFAGSDQSAAQIGNLSSRELSRGQKLTSINAALEEASRQIYNSAVAEDF